MTQLLAKMPLLYRALPHDPITISAVVASLVAIGLFACWLPVRNAARVEPVQAVC